MSTEYSGMARITRAPDALTRLGEESREDERPLSRFLNRLLMRLRTRLDTWVWAFRIWRMKRSDGAAVVSLSEALLGPVAVCVILAGLSVLAPSAIETMRADRALAPAAAFASPWAIGRSLTQVVDAGVSSARAEEHAPGSAQRLPLIAAVEYDRASGGAIGAASALLDVVAAVDAGADENVAAPVDAVVLKGLPVETELSRGVRLAEGNWVLAFRDLKVVDVKLKPSAPPVETVVAEIGDDSRHESGQFLIELEAADVAPPTAQRGKAQGGLKQATPKWRKQGDARKLKFKRHVAKAAPSAQPSVTSPKVVQVGNGAPKAQVVPVAAVASSTPKIRPFERPAVSPPVFEILTPGSAGQETFTNFSYLGGRTK